MTMSDQQTQPEPLLDSEELVAIVEELLDALLYNAGFEAEEVAMRPSAGTGPLTGTIAINSDPVAKLIVATDYRACSALAHCWGLVEGDVPTEQDARDALGELANLIGGQVKTAFEEETWVGIPEVADGEPGTAAEVAEVFHPLGRFGLQFFTA
jgi:hypothetical protein